MSKQRLVPLNAPWLAADPTTPSLRAADHYANSGTKKLRLWDGTAWGQIPREDTANTYSAAQTFNAAVNHARGAFINADGGAANTLFGSELTAQASFTDSRVSDLIIKEPRSQRILLGSQGATAAQAASLVIDGSISNAASLQGNGASVAYALSLASGTVDGVFGVAGELLAFWDDAVPGDVVVRANSATKALRLGAASGGQSTMRITGSDVSIYDTGLAAARTVPRGKIGEAHLTANTAQNVTATAFTTVVGTVSTNNGVAVAGANLSVSVPVVNGRTYLILAPIHVFSSVATDQVDVQVIASTGSLTSYIPRMALPGAARAVPAVVIGWYYATATGSVIFTAQVSRVTGGTGNVNVALGSSISVLDVGA